MKFLRAEPSAASLTSDLFVFAHGALPVFLKHLDVHVCHASSLPPEAPLAEES
jgi:hypothetical protein